MVGSFSQSINLASLTRRFWNKVQMQRKGVAEISAKEEKKKKKKNEDPVPYQAYNENEDTTESTTCFMS